MQNHNKKQANNDNIEEKTKLRTKNKNKILPYKYLQYWHDFLSRLSDHVKCEVAYVCNV